LDVAMGGYNMVRQSDPKFAPAYERLAEIQRSRGNAQEAVATLVDMTKQVPSAHSYSLLARAYVALINKNVATPQAADGEKEAENEKPRRSGLGGLLGRRKKEETPQQKKNAPDPNAALALRAADQAVKLDARSAEAHLARGLALTAMDQGGNKQSDALMEFGTAVLLDDKDAANHYGLGYGRYTFAAYAKEGDAQKAELQRAVTALKEALKLRPDYYEAHRELAYCYHLLGDTDAAMRQYQLATSYRGSATDKDEVAGGEVALASLHQQKAKSSEGEEKKSHEQASEGYMGDAKETTPNLVRAMAIMNRARLGSSIIGNMPPGVQAALDPAGAIRSQIRSRITVPGGFSLPFP
jgi:tetratricopeptide (TPR) repeat protein